MSDQMRYFAENDTLHITIKPGTESASVEISPSITAELDDAGELIGVEILEACKYIRDGVLETVQARILQMKT